MQADREGRAEELGACYAKSALRLKNDKAAETEAAQASSQISLLLAPAIKLWLHGSVAGSTAHLLLCQERPTPQERQGC